MEAFDLRRNLLLGTAVGGLCSDGVFPGHPWAEWCQRTRPRDAEPFRYADHWERWKEDADLMHGAGLECCRFVLDWAHIEPEQGRYDDAAIARVREEILYLRALGLRVTLVLHEFSDPAWFLRLGGWSREDNIRFFLEYVEKLLRTVGHLAEDYVPISQPNLLAWNGWYTGAWPPGKKSALALRRVVSVLTAAHIESYHRIHALRAELGLRGTRVGASVYMRMLRTGNKKTPLQLGAGTVDRLFQGAMGEAMACGRFSPAVQNLLHAKKDCCCDFHDLCCYALPESAEGVPGAGRVPDADELVYCAAERSALLRRPIFITEGPGLAAPSPRRMYECVRALSGAGLPVERYFSMRFSDGFEPCGLMRLGIAQTDAETGARRLRASGEFLAQTARSRGVTEEMCAEWAERA